MPTRLWELGAGCLLFLGLKQTNRLLSVLEKLPPLVVLIAIVSVFLVPGDFSKKTTVAVVLLTVVLINCLRTKTVAYRLLTHPQVIYIGLISYSLYLWHWGILSLSRWTIGIHWWSIPFQIFLILVLAIGSYHYIETPLRHSEWSQFRWKSILYGLLASTVVAIGLTTFNKLIASKIYLGNEKSKHLKATWGVNSEGEYIENCHVKGKYSKPLLRECLRQQKTHQQNFFLIGDSHARNYLVAIRKAFPFAQTTYLTMGHGCTFLPSSMISSELEEKTRCLEYTQDVAAYLSEETKKGDVVFIGQRLYLNPERYTLTYISFLGELANTLKTMEIPLIILDGTAPPPLDPELCFPTPWRPLFSLPVTCSTSISEVKDRYSEFDRMAKSLSSYHTNVFYIPLRDGLCTRDICGQITNVGTPIWHDIGHITEQSSAELAPLLIERLEDNGFSKKFPYVFDLNQ